jgi:UDP-N-acetylglucosamine diphosphorylase/glucosamine-1-phosphate N-acetyltransferase
MNTIVFEDDAVERLAPLTTARPACDLTIGCMTLVEALGHFGVVHRGLRPHLAAYLSALAGGRDAFWGAAGPAPPAERPVSTHGAAVLVVNARVVPSRGNLAALRGLLAASRRAVVRAGGTIAAAVLHVDADGGGPDRGAIDRILASGGTGEPAAVLDGLGLPEADVAVDLLCGLADLLDAHERSLEDALAVLLDAGRFREVRPGLHVAGGGRVAEQVVVRRGPVLVDAEADVGPFTCLDGPLWIGPRARVNPHSWLRAGTALSRECRAGGEIEATVMEAFSNKPHDGFLGHSHVGSWVNVAAGTVTGNLKATYGIVRLHDPAPDGGRTTVDTGRQFCGGFIGDFVRTAINTSIPCGARIGFGATIGGTVPERVPPFTNLLLPGAPRATAEQAVIVLERMMARRGLTVHEADSRLLDFLAAIPPAAGG